MAGKTIDDLGEFIPPINEQLKGGDNAAATDKLFIPARVKQTGSGKSSRTIRISLDNPLMLPQPRLDSGGAFDEYYGGAALRTDGAERHWANVRAVYASGEMPSVGSVTTSGGLDLYYPPTGVELGDYTDFCVLYRGGWGTDLSPWFSLDAARGADYDLNDAAVDGGADRGYFLHNNGPHMRVHPPPSTGNNRRAYISVNRSFNSTILAVLVR